MVKKIYFIAGLFAIVLEKRGFAIQTSHAHHSSLHSSSCKLKYLAVGGKTNIAVVVTGEFLQALNDFKKVFVNGKNYIYLLIAGCAISLIPYLKINCQKFATFYGAIFLLAKTVNAPIESVYRQYYFQKKVSWPGNNSEIRNPYFGNVMLSRCGGKKIL